MRLSRFFSLLLLPALLLGAGCAKNDPAPAPAPPPTVPPVAAPVVSLEQALRADLNATVFLAALRKTALLPALSAPAAPLTVLAPTNAAFAELTGTPFTTAASIEALPDAGPDVAELRRLVQYHLLPVQALSAMPAFERRTCPTLLPAADGTPLDVYIYNFAEGRLIVNGVRAARALVAGQAAGGGWVHALDHVLRPPARTLADELRERAEAPATEFSLFWQALQRPAAAPLLALLTDAQLDHTLLLPTDAGLLLTLRQRNPAWTSLAAVPDADLLHLLRLHFVPQAVPSTFLFHNEGRVATLAGGSDLASRLHFQGGFSHIDGNDWHFTVTTASGFSRRPGDAPAQLLDIDQLATNGLLHTLDLAIFP